MRTVPAGLIATVLADRPDLQAVVTGCGRQVGVRVEVDLNAVEALSTRLAHVLTVYDAHARAFWRALQTGTAAGAAYTLVRRTLMTHVQSTAKKDRRDLVEVYEALTGVAVLSDIVDELTAAEPDLDALAGLLDAAGGGQVLPAEAGAVAVQVLLDPNGALPDVLGGVRMPGEVRRVLTLTARHAAWRDRRVRRLARVEVAADEMWPDPAPARAALAGVQVS